LTDLVRMDAVLVRQFVQRALTFGRVQRHPKFEIGAESSAFLGYRSATLYVLKKVWFFTLARGPVFGGQL
jgi:hypothetical protein